LEKEGRGTLYLFYLFYPEQEGKLYIWAHFQGCGWKQQLRTFFEREFYLSF
jgi:hypothetical protein